MSKLFETRRTARDTIDRARRYRAYVRTQPGIGWASERATNGHLQLTAMAGAAA